MEASARHTVVKANEYIDKKLFQLYMLDTRQYQRLKEAEKWHMMNEVGFLCSIKPTTDDYYVSSTLEKIGEYLIKGNKGPETDTKTSIEIACSQ